jgi:hypothetical protein
VLISKRRRIPELTALDYLNSCHLANIVFGDQIEFLGVIPTEEGPRLVIRQPEVEAADPDNPHPMKHAINRWLRSAGFEYEEGAWTRESDLVVVSDEHEGNFILAHEGIRPIDLHLSRLPWAKGEVIPWNENPAKTGRPVPNSSFAIRISSFPPCLPPSSTSTCIPTTRCSTARCGLIRS